MIDSVNRRPLISHPDDAPLEFIKSTTNKDITFTMSTTTTTTAALDHLTETKQTKDLSSSLSLSKLRMVQVSEVLDSWRGYTKGTFLNNMSCGFFSGMIVNGALNPWDRALYLSLMHRRHFLDKRNFRRPFHGVGQTLIQRSLSTGLYFPLEDFFLKEFEENFSLARQHPNFTTGLAGNFAGMINGLVLNPLAYIKYQCWGRNNYSFWDQAGKMYANGGWTIFLRGSTVTMFRDAVFGCVYGVLRNIELNYDADDEARKRTGRVNKPFFQDLVAAGVATVASSPPNYVRNIQFHASTKLNCPSVWTVLTQLEREVMCKKSWFDRFVLIQHRLRLGWGTLRVATGMALGSKLYSLCHTEGKLYNEITDNND